jgi:hypothetical protein
MRLPRSAVLATLAASLATLLTTTACDDDDKATATPAANPTPDGGAADGAPVATADGGAGTDATPPLIPLTEWVHDLVTGLGPMSPPDTVDDKHIMDTDDPAAFDSLLQ